MAASGPRWLERLAGRGATSQVAVAGAYAWVVTVAPALWSPGEPVLARIAPVAALASLVAATVAERWWPSPVRVGCLWAFALTSALTWMSAPGLARSLRYDAAAGLAGMLGWALFAVAWAGPALGERRAPDRVVDEGPLEARRSLAAGDAAYLAGGAAIALALQLEGWHVASAERALLVRAVALAGGLAFIGAAAELGLARHGKRAQRKWGARLRSASAPLGLLAALGLAGLLMLTRD
jgi:hypothetical protein